MFSKTYRTVYSILLAGFLSVMVFAGTANAHIYVFKAGPMSAGTGAAVKVTAGLAEPLFKMDMSDAMLESTGWTTHMEAAVSYADGTREEISAASFKLNASDPAKATGSVADVKIAKKGTAVVNGIFEMLKDGKKTRCFAKTFINLTDDGMATKRLGDSSVAEIVFLDNVKAVKNGDTIRVKAFLKGKPLAGAEISATFDGAPARSSDGPENEYITVETDKNGEASFKVDSAKLWGITLEYTDGSDKIRYRSSALFPVQ